VWNLRADDRSNDEPTYVAPPPAPGVWRQVPPWSEQGLFPNTFLAQWSAVRTWSVPSAEEFRCPPPPALTSELFVHDVVLGRIVGGMHFRNSGVVGAESGRQIATWVTSHSLQPTSH
jgi:hypothetical protein